MKITTVIFDLDGTLLDTLGDLTDSINYAIVRRGFPEVSLEQTRQYCGNGIRCLVQRSIGEKCTEELLDICLDEFRSAYQERMENRTHPYKGIMPMLRKLREMGISVGVISNKYDLAAKRLIRDYFGELVHVTYGERPGVPKKPDPTSTLSLLKELGGEPSTALYVGDSEPDMETAKRAGLPAIGVTWGFRTAEVLKATGADVIINDPSELFPLLDNGPMDTGAVGRAFAARGFEFKYFPKKDQAAEYIAQKCAGKSVSLGGSMTLKEMGFPESFDGSTEVHWHWVNKGEYFQTPDIYLTSANALSETGEIVNIDGNCNRVSGTLFGAKSCIFVCGTNKLRPTLEAAISRARNIAAPLNAKRLNKATPCAKDSKCHDCLSPERICRAMVIHMGPPQSMSECELVLIGEELGL